MRVSGRIAAALALVAVISPVPARADPGATESVTVVAVANGNPVNGYSVANRQPSANLRGCLQPSPAAVARNIYACEPDQAVAQVCWPAQATVLCAVDPWSKTLRRFPTPGTLPPVDPPATPMPFALTLDEGTNCVLATGVDWGGRADDMVPAYGCNTQGSTLSMGVLVDPGQDPTSAIDRSQPQWTARVGQLGPRGASFEAPRRYTVRTAWFAGN